MRVTQLIYSSRNVTFDQPRERIMNIRSILAISMRNNERDGLTGFLIADRSWFFQVLEGDRDRVQMTFKRIEADPRHDTVTLKAMRNVSERSFPHWSMMGAMRTSVRDEIFLAHGLGHSQTLPRIDGDGILGLAIDLRNSSEVKRAAFQLT